MKLSIPVTLLLMCASAWAQTDRWFYQPLGQLKDFLQLSDGQLQSILTNNEEHNRWSSEKQTRISQLQTEIAQETAKDRLDPNALGVRYAEVETICREMKDRVNVSRTRNLAVLSQDQKTKLKVLEDAVKLAPIIAQAQGGNLISGFSYPIPYLTSSSGSSSNTLIGGMIAPTGGCYMPFPAVVMRNGDFGGTTGNVTR